MNPYRESKWLKKIKQSFKIIFTEDGRKYDSSILMIKISIAVIFNP